MRRLTDGSLQRSLTTPVGGTRDRRCAMPDRRIRWTLADELDFQQLLPHLTDEQRRTLGEWTRLTCANGHHWIAALEDE